MRLHDNQWVLSLGEWHRRRAQQAAVAELKMPDHIAATGMELTTALWKAMEHEFSEMRQEATIEIDLLEHHAQEEREHLHKIIGDQQDEIQRLKNEVERLSAPRR